MVVVLLIKSWQHQAELGSEAWCFILNEYYYVLIVLYEQLM